MEDKSVHHESLKDKAIEEFKAYWIIVIYLAVLHRLAASLGDVLLTTGRSCWRQPRNAVRDAKGYKMKRLKRVVEVLFGCVVGIVVAWLLSKVWPLPESAGTKVSGKQGAA